MPRILQSDIHSNFSTDSGVWANYKSQIIDLWEDGDNVADFSYHLVREFNKKVHGIGLTGLMFEPYNAGFSFEAVQLGNDDDELMVNSFVFDELNISFDNENMFFQ